MLRHAGGQFVLKTPNLVGKTRKPVLNKHPADLSAVLGEGTLPLRFKTQRWPRIPDCLSAKN